MGEDKSFVQPAVPKFDGYYEHWSMMMENLLRSKEYWNVVENGIPATTETSTPEEIKAAADAKLKDFKAKNYLFQAIERGIMETILDKSTVKGIMDGMRQKYMGSSKVKHAQLQNQRCEFEILRMKEGETVTEYFSRALAIVNKLKALGENVQETTVVEKVLRSMTKNFNYVVCSTQEGNDVTKMTIDELQSSLMIHEQRMGEVKEEEQALKTTGNGVRGRDRGRNSRGGRGRGRQQWNKETIKCYNCKKLGHYQYECPNWEEKANYAEEGEEEDVILPMAETEVNYEKELTENKKELENAEDAHCEEQFTRKIEGIESAEGIHYKNSDEEDAVLILMAHTEDIKTRPKVWYLDSGCSNHMSGYKQWFIDLNE